MGGELPKQYRLVQEEAVIAKSIRALLQDARVSQIQCVIHPDDEKLYLNAIADLDKAPLLPPVYGGDTRSLSVRNGLSAINADYVLIHDAARPFLSKDCLTRVIDEMIQSGAVFPALPVSDALWGAEDQTARYPVSRDGLWRAQTPQGFRLDIIRGAHEKTNGNALDDVAVAHEADITCKIVEGCAQNIKLTYPEDFEMENFIPDIRFGTGFDVHKFAEGNAVILCGVSIPFEKSLSGHSDADVAMHAITDAIFGALAEGDIGQWFPPSDAQWKGAASEIFLRKACERVTERGFRLTSIDCTIICELPKIGPHAEAMRSALSEIMGLDIARISVKATTSEGLGFTGRGEGIAAQASASLVSV